MRGVDFDSRVARKDAYGNVTVHDGETTQFKGFTIDGNFRIWGRNGEFRGKATSRAHAKELIREWAA